MHDLQIAAWSGPPSPWRTCSRTIHGHSQRRDEFQRRKWWRRWVKTQWNQGRPSALRGDEADRERLRKGRQSITRERVQQLCELPILYTLVDTKTQTKHKTQDTRHKTQDTRHKTQDTRHKTQDTRHKTQDTRHKTQDTRHKKQVTSHKKQEARQNKTTNLP